MLVADAAILLSCSWLWLRSSCAARVFSAYYPAAMTLKCAACRSSESRGKYWLSYWLVYVILLAVETLLVRRLLGDGIAGRFEVWRHLVLFWCVFGQGKNVFYERAVMPVFAWVFEVTLVRGVGIGARMCCDVWRVAYVGTVKVPLEVWRLAKRRVFRRWV